MRQFICNVANILLKPFKIKALKAKELAELVKTRERFISLYSARCTWDEPQNRDAACVVFSKDRAMQLHAFISSFYAKIPRPQTLHVLYTATHPAHQKSYEELKSLSQDLPVQFHRQTSNSSFRQDLIAMLQSLTVDKIIFFVDDIVITEKIEFDDLLKFDTDTFVPSLRMGKNIKKNYTTSCVQPPPNFLDNQIDESGKIVWQWQDGILDWGYPLSVDGHIFSRREFLAMLNLIPFSAPNSLEDALQTFKPLFLERFGVAYEKSRLMNIPCNKVQTENKNIAGHIHQDELLKKWQDGYAIDLSAIDGYHNRSPHEEVEIKFIPRGNAFQFAPSISG